MRTFLPWLLVTAPLAAQIQLGEPILVTTPLQEIRRVLPDGLGNGSAVGCVTFDPDADLMHDVAILWTSGEVVFSYAPEIMASFVALPVAGASGIARVPAGAPQLPGTGGDRLLVTTSGGLKLLHFDALAVGSAATPTGFLATAVAVPAGWQNCLRVDTHWDGTNCWLLAVDSDLHTVRIGMLVGNHVLPAGVAVAGNPVRQLLAIDYDLGGSWTIVARTDAGLESWDTSGQPVSPPLAADTYSQLGGITAVIQAGETKLAWLAQRDFRWRLRICRHGAVQEMLDIPASPLVPGRFRPTGLSTIALPGGDQALVIGQNTSTYQLVLVVDPQTGLFTPACAFAFAGITPNVDNCPPIVEDMNNDDHADFTTVLTSQHALQIDTGLPTVVANTLYGLAIDADHVDFLPRDCTLGHGLVDNDTITFFAEIPNEPAPPGLHVQVVAWSQTVLDPTGGSGSFQALPLDGAVRNYLYPVVTGEEPVRPLLSMRLDDPVTGNWSPTRHYYFLLRLIAKTGNVVTWSSPAQFVGFVASGGTPPSHPGTLNYLMSISSNSGGGGGGGSVVVQGSNRNVGVIQKPDRIDPPNSTLKPPAPGQASPQAPPTSW